MTNMVDNARLEASHATRTRWETRYREGVTPWDTHQTPPEVINFWQSSRLAPEGMAIDLGCGPGTNLRYLAGLGLHVIGIEIAGAPLLMARERLRRFAPESNARVHLLCADVAILPLQGINAQYILDIGCYHSLPRTTREGYVNGIIANLAPGGYYQLYGFDTDPTVPEPPSGPIGIDAGEIVQRFTPHLEVVEENIARPDRRPCRWYLLQRT